MRVDEAIQQPGMKERMLKEDIMKSIHVAVPGEIVSYDSTQRTAVVQPVIREWKSKDPPPLLLDVPVFMWGNYIFTPTKGDGCLVVCADSCIDAWLQSGGVSTPIVARNHSLSDGFAFVGFRSGDGKNIDDLLAVVSKNSNGLCPKLPDENTTNKYLRQDGTWDVPPEQTYMSHKLLGTFANETSLGTALDSELGTMSNYTVEFVRFVMSSSTTHFRANHYYGTLSRPGSAVNGVLVVSNVSDVVEPVNGAKVTTGWVYRKLV